MKIQKSFMKRSIFDFAALFFAISFIGNANLVAQDDNEELRKQLLDQGVSEERVDDLIKQLEEQGITSLEGMEFQIQSAEDPKKDEEEPKEEDEDTTSEPLPVAPPEAPRVPPRIPLEDHIAPDANERETAKVVRGEMQMEVNIPGVFVADDKDEIRMEPEKYSGDLIVTRIVPEGANVKQGDVLIEFDGAEVLEAIETAQNEATDAGVELKKAQAEYQSANIDLKAKTAQLQSELGMIETEINAAVAKQELEKAEKLKSIQDSKDSLADLEVDFETLKQVYAERGIDPEESNSGQIIIDREIKSIENAKKRIAVQERELEYFTKFDQSKAQLEKELSKVKKQAEIDKAKINLAAVVAEKKSVVDKAQRKLDAANRKVEGLQNDLQQLRVISPRDGVVFYGQTGNELPAGIIIGGNIQDIRKELRIGGRVTTHRILLTVATMENLSIKMSLTENDIQYIKSGLPITVYPNAYPNLNVEGELTKVDQIATRTGFQPNAPRRFDVIGKCTDLAKELRSGMNCRVMIHPEKVSDILLVPIVAVFSDNDLYYCFVKTENGYEAREVETGLSNFEFVEITSGLAEGDEVCWPK